MIPARTVLLLALVALVAAQQQSGPWWLPLAMSTQRDLAFNQPLDTAALLGTHNSYNWWNASLGLNPTMEPTFNQRHSVTEQLTTFGVRYLELDVHYITAVDNSTGQPYFADPLVVCHSSTDTYDTCYGSSNLGTFCTTFGLVNLGPEGTGCFVTPGATPSARTQFGEVMTWLRANPNEFVFIYVEWRANLGAALTSFTTMLSDVFNTSRFTPSDLSANGGVWPSRKQMIANGKRVALHSMQQDLTSIGLFYETFNNQPGVYGGFNPNYEQVAKFTLYPACQSVGFKIDPLPNNKFLSFYEDRSYLTLPGLGTVLNGSEGTGAFDRTSLIAAQKCGNPVRLDMIDYDYLSGWIWSWEVNEPNYGNVAYMQASGRWKADNTYTSSTSRPFVCRNDTDGSLALSSATGSWLQGTTSCDPGTTWDVPRTALENDKLAATLSSGGTAWLRYWNWAFTTGTWTDAMPKCGDSAANTAAEQCDGGASCTNCLCTGGQLPTTPASTGCVATAGQTASPPPATPRGTFAPTTAPPPTTRPNLTSTSAAAAAYVAASLLVAALVAAIVV